MILDPPSSPHAGEGYLSLNSPHDINNLLVAYLGHDEILLLCCDDGDVVAYSTRLIHEAVIAQRQQGFDGMPKPVAVFLLTNVGGSAWGLAVHTKARKIAVSANTHCVRIISFGLVDSQDGSDTEDDLGESMDFENSDRHDRRTTHWTTLPEMDDNLPCVEFCNTDDDPEGRFIAAGNITGTRWIFDVISQKLLEKTKISFCATDTSGYSECGCSLQFAHAVWNLHWLDTRAFRTQPEDEMPGKFIEDLFHVLPDSQWHVPHSSAVFLTKGVTTSNSEKVAVVTSPVGRHNTASGDLVDSTVVVTMNDSHEMEDDAQDHALEDTGTIVRLCDLGKYAVEPLTSREREGGPPPIFQLDSSSWLQAEDVPRPCCPLMQISHRDVFISQSPDSEESTKVHVGVMELFQQWLQVQGNWLAGFARRGFHHLDRNVYSQVISELGVVIIATGKGRAAVLSLLQTPVEQEGGAARIHYFFRVDWILPFAGQEQAGERPAKHELIGIAASPVQGMLGLSKPGIIRRWRLLLTYRDHSVLSYEIGREGSSAGEAVQIAPLLF